MINFAATITTTKTVRFYEAAVNNGTINGNVEFNDNSRNGENGVVNGNGTFKSCSKNKGQITGNVVQNNSDKACITIDPIAVDVTFILTHLGQAFQDRQLTYTATAVSLPAGLPLFYQWQYTEDHGLTWQNYSDGRIDYYWPPPWVNQSLPNPGGEYYRIISGAQTNTLVVRESWANVAYRQHTKRRIVVSAPGAEAAMLVTSIY